MNMGAGLEKMGGVTKLLWCGTAVLVGCAVFLAFTLGSEVDATTRTVALIAAMILVSFAAGACVAVAFVVTLLMKQAKKVQAQLGNLPKF